MKQIILLLTILSSFSLFAQGQYDFRTSLDSPENRLKVFVCVDSFFFYIDSALQSKINPDWINNIEVIKDESQKHIYSNKKGAVLVYPKKKYSDKTIKTIATNSNIDISPISDQLSKKQEFVIYSGIGFHNYKIDTTSMLQVISELGTDFELIKHNETSYDLIYKRFGVTFFCDNNFSSSKIRGISFTKPFNGITDKGIRLNLSKMKNVEAAYDELDWYTTNGAEYWWSEYKGIEYGVSRIMKLPQYPLDEEKHINKTIEIITVLNPLDF